MRAWRILCSPQAARPSARKQSSFLQTGTEMMRSLAISALALGCAALLALSPGVKAQGMGPAPIRIETNEVLVPVFVWNDPRWQKLQRNPPRDPAWYKDAIIRNLTSNNFQLFEDGQPQTIQRVDLESPSVAVIKDNLGQHYEYRTGAGRWIYPDFRYSSHTVLSWPTYLLAYSPPEAPPGSCHHVKVIVKDVPDAAFESRNEYCTSRYSELDPLKGTRFGKDLEEDLASGKNGNIDLTLAAAVSSAGSNNARVNVAIGFKPQSLHYELEHGTFGHLFESIGLLGMVYAKDGTVVTRFSDFDCCDYSNGSTPAWLMIGSPGRANILYAPSGYDTQLHLVPGQYDLRIVISDGTNFGRAEISLTVEPYDATQLALSDIVLAARSRQAPSGPSNGSAKLVGRYVPLISDGAEFGPSAGSLLQLREPLYIYFEVYVPQTTGSAAPNVDAHLRIVDAKTGEPIYGPINFSITHHRKAVDCVFAVGRQVALRKLATGSLRLEVQAIDSNGRTTPWRSANFSLQ